MKSKLVLERFTELLAFISQRAQDEHESAMESLVSIVEQADRQQKWLRQQARRTKGTR